MVIPKTTTAFMDYLIAGIIVIVCIVAIVLALRVLQESPKLGPPKKDEEDD